MTKPQNWYLYHIRTGKRFESITLTSTVEESICAGEKDNTNDTFNGQEAKDQNSGTQGTEQQSVYYANLVYDHWQAWYYSPSDTNSVENR